MQDETRHEEPKEVQVEAQQPVDLPATETKQDGQVNAPEAQAPHEGELPKEASERTREQFEKLKAHNQALAEKLKQYEQKKPSIFDFTPQPKVAPQVQQAQPQVQNEIKPIVPDSEGYVDVNAINATIQQIQAEKEQALRKAEEAARLAQEARENVSRFEIRQESQRVFNKHPELDPDNPQFSEDLTHKVKLELLRQMTEEGTQDYMRAAETVKNLYKEKKTGNEEARKAREEVNAFTPQSSPSPIADQDLVARTHKGDRDAIYERLKRSGY